MTTGTLERRKNMGKTRGRPPGDKEYVTVKLEKSVAMKAKAVATHRAITVGEYLTELTHGAINRDYAKVLRELESSDD